MGHCRVRYYWHYAVMAFTMITTIAITITMVFVGKKVILSEAEADQDGSVVT